MRVTFRSGKGYHQTIITDKNSSRQEKGLAFHENWLLANDIHEITKLIELLKVGTKVENVICCSVKVGF